MSEQRPAVSSVKPVAVQRPAVSPMSWARQAVSSVTGPTQAVSSMPGPRKAVSPMGQRPAVSTIPGPRQTVLPVPGPRQAAIPELGTASSVGLQPKKSSPETVTAPPTPEPEQSPAPVKALRLAAGWERRLTPDGREFFVNHLDQTTHWTLPDSGRAPEIEIGGIVQKLPSVVSVASLCELAVCEENYPKVSPLLAF